MYYTILYSITLPLSHPPLLSRTVLYCIVLYYTVLYCIILYCTVLYRIVLYCTVLYCIIHFMLDLRVSHFLQIIFRVKCTCHNTSHVTCNNTSHVTTRHMLHMCIYDSHLVKPHRPIQYFQNTLTHPFCGISPV